MARFILFCLVVAELAATLAMARPLSVMVRATSSIQLHGIGVANPPSTLPSSGKDSGMAPETALDQKHPFNKSAAGGEVILGGLATASFAVIFCYIRITRKRVEEEKS